MATKPTGPPPIDPWRVLLPYGLAIAAQLPMLILYFRQLWSRPHYQPFAVAIIATVVLAFYRWPNNLTHKFRRSYAADTLIVLSLGAAFLGLLFVEPWFAALSWMLLVSSLLARTIDKETLQSLWPCSLPLYVYLILPDGLDFRLITKLQLYSANYTSRLLDLAGLGHHMDGVVIRVPGLKEYGIEQACSGVQSFFTLLLVAVVFIVMSRRYRVPSAGGALLSIVAGLFTLYLSGLVPTGGWSEFTLLIAIGFFIHAFVGFRAAMLILSAVFWAVFMNTVRILLIPLSDFFFEFDLSSGLRHDILGYVTLIAGILLLLSTDQFLLFLFGPVDPNSDESSSLGRLITKFWNSVIAGGSAQSDGRKKKRRTIRPMSEASRRLVWTCAGIMVAFGLYQLYDVQQSLRQSGLRVRFFDVDVTVDFTKGDIPETIDTWRQVDYKSQTRSIGSDLGQRSDVWQFSSPRCAAVASLDQTFPGWHELTTCYQNQGWMLIDRKVKYPSEYLGKQELNGEENEQPWSYVEATFKKKTGEKGYLLFSHFDAFGDGISSPRDWGKLNSFVTRAKNRLSHRIRSQLFEGEAYQTQVFLTSFGELSDDLKEEVNLRYLKIREEMRKRFKEKRLKEDAVAMR